MQFNFGAGQLVAKRTDVTNLQPPILGTCQEWSADFASSIVDLYGQNRVAVDTALAELKITGKIKFARMMNSIYNNLFFGNIASTTSATAGIDLNGPENHTSATTTTTLVVTLAASFAEDFGLYYHNGSIAFIPVTTAPSIGQYSITTNGTYTINTTDSTIAGGIDAYYTSTFTTLFQSSLSNQLMGTGSIFELFGSVPYQVQGVQKRLSIKLNSCRSSKMTWALKNKQYLIPEMDFTAFADANGNIGTISTTE